jgi:hypothetical protein
VLFSFIKFAVIPDLKSCNVHAVCVVLNSLLVGIKHAISDDDNGLYAFIKVSFLFGIIVSSICDEKLYINEDILSSLYNPYSNNGSFFENTCVGFSSLFVLYITILEHSPTNELKKDIV